MTSTIALLGRKLKAPAARFCQHFLAVGNVCRFAEIASQRIFTLREGKREKTLPEDASVGLPLHNFDSLLCVLRFTP
jgi:hypothetical protein